MNRFICCYCAMTQCLNKETMAIFTWLTCPVSVHSVMSSVLLNIQRTDEPLFHAVSYMIQMLVEKRHWRVTDYIESYLFYVAWFQGEFDNSLVSKPLPTGSLTALPM